MVRPYISIRTTDEGQNVAIHLGLSWMGKEDGVRGLTVDLATFLYDCTRIGCQLAGSLRNDLPCCSLVFHALYIIDSSSLVNF